MKKPDLFIQMVLPTVLLFVVVACEDLEDDFCEDTPLAPSKLDMTHETEALEILEQVDNGELEVFTQVDQVDSVEVMTQEDEATSKGASLSISAASDGYQFLATGFPAGYSAVADWYLFRNGGNYRYLGRTFNFDCAAMGVILPSSTPAGTYYVRAITSVWDDIFGHWVHYDIVSNEAELKKIGEGVSYRAHVQNIGWMVWVHDGTKAGTTGQGRRMEAIRIKLGKEFNSDARITYRAHVKGEGWQNWVSNGQTAGTTGESRRMEAIQIKLQNVPSGYSARYQAHVKGKGWLDWVHDGQTAGTTGQSRRMEAIHIVISKRSCKIGSYDGANCYIGKAPPGTNAFIYANRFYYSPASGSNRCPYPGSWFDGANCFVASIPSGAKGFIYRNGWYVHPTWSDIR